MFVVLELWAPTQDKMPGFVKEKSPSKRISHFNILAGKLRSRIHRPLRVFSFRDVPNRDHNMSNRADSNMSWRVVALFPVGPALSSLSFRVHDERSLIAAKECQRHDGTSKKLHQL